LFKKPWYAVAMEKKKHAGGRPPKYKTAAELQSKIEDYFDSCWIEKITQVTDIDGKITESNVRYQEKPYTIAGLASYLGFTSRQSLLNYDINIKFLDIIKRAKFKIEANVEEYLLEGKNAAGPIFWLKNHADYKDKQEIEHSGELGIKQLLQEIDGETLGPPVLRGK
jgi:hypothetical protein